MINNIDGNGNINTPKIPNTPTSIARTKLVKICIAMFDEFSMLVLNKLGLNKFKFIPKVTNPTINTKAIANIIAAYPTLT